MKLVLICLIALHAAFALHDNGTFINGRIVGGNETNILDHPYQVSIEYLSNLRCGGSIIARTWILTAAHCVDGLNLSYLRVRVGTSYHGLGGTVLNVSQVEVHANYSSLTIDFDIALLRLATPVPLSITAQITRIADNSEELVEGSVANVTGWGYTSESGDTSSILRVVQVPILNHSVCKDLYSSLGQLVSDRMICAGLWDGGKDACSGDGGGPLVVGSKVFGIASWGMGCARPQRPGVYTNIGALRDWITEKTGI